MPERSRRFKLLFCLILTLICCRSVVSHAAGFDQSSTDYTACAALVKSNPQAALSRAETWLNQTSMLSARHCKAMAHFTLGQYGEAAKELEVLADSVTYQQPLLWFNLLSQASKARFAAGEIKRAQAHLNLALETAINHEQDPSMVPIIIEMLLDRSAILQQTEKPLEAIQDLDHALALKEDNVRALIQRAKVLDKLGKSTLALIDIRKALVIEPQNLEANGLRRELEQKTAGK